VLVLSVLAAPVAAGCGECQIVAHAGASGAGLRRSTSTLAVGYRRVAPAGSLVVLTPSGEVPLTARPVTRHVSAVTLERAGGGTAAALDSVRDALLADPDVRFAYPALVHTPSGQLLLPTDRIVARVRPGVDAPEVTRRLPPVLTVVRRLEGTGDEYLLRLTAPRTADPIAVAADLAREPWVAWAEPDFIREYAR
jgi:hypothetical protein